MKKAKILVIVLVLSLALTGAAYALWNQNITVTTSAAMGDMDVQLSCDAWVYPLSLMPGIGSYWFGTHTYADMEPYMNPLTGTVAGDKQSLDIKVEKMYPGAKYGVNFTVKNTGDVPFSLLNCTITNTSGNPNLFAKLTGSFQFYYQKADGARTLITVPAKSLSDGTLATAITNALKDVVLYPGDQLIGWTADQDQVTTFMQVLVDESIAGDELENTSTAFSIDFNWQQCDPIQYDFPTEP